MTLVHRCRFFEWVPEQILCLGTNEANLLAVGRINGDIEIWNDEHYCGKKITGQSGQSLRCLTWGKGTDSHRLFSGTDLGFIHEWNLLTLQQEASTDSFGGWVTSLSVNSSGTRLAAGTQAGVSIFDISEGQLTYVHKLHNSKIVTAVCFHPKEDTLFASSGNMVRIYSRNGPKYAESGHFKLDNKVFSLLVLPDSTVVIGTNKGEVQMWNGKLKVRVATFNEHQAAVVALAASQDGNAVYASGGDPKICMFKAIGEGKWIYSNHQRRHTHEVSSLAMIKDRVISGSSDTMLILYNQSAFANSSIHGIRKLLPYPHSPAFSHAFSARLVLYRKCDGLELWRLGVGESPVKILDMELKKDRHYLRTSAISPNGKYIACANVHTVKLFSVEYHEDTVTVEPIDLPPLITPHKLVLTNTTLALANHESLQILDLETLASPNEISLSEQIDDYKEAPINTMVTSPDGSYVAVGDMNNNIQIYNLDKKKFVCAIPKISLQHTALGFQPESSVIALADVTGKFYMFDYNTKTFTKWSREFNKGNLPANYALLSGNDPVVGITYEPTNPNGMLLWGSKFLASVVVQKDADVQMQEIDAPPSKKSKTNPTAIKILGQYSDLMWVGFVEESMEDHTCALVVVERPWLEVIPHLPNVFDLKLFGR
jgi:WD40 repeat protein